MNSDNSTVLTIIAVLLALLLAERLHGADALRSGASIALYLGVGLVLIAAFFIGMRESAERSKDEGHAWRWKYLLWPGIAGALLGFGLAALEAGTMKGPKFEAAYQAIPYRDVPLLLIGLSLVVRTVEGAHKFFRTSAEERQKSDSKLTSKWGLYLLVGFWIVTAVVFYALK